GKPRRGRAAVLHAPCERAPLRPRADQAEVREVAASEDGLRKLLVERMAMGHDQEVALRRSRVHFRCWSIGAGDRYVCGQVARELILAAVDPGDTTGQVGERAHHRAAYMTRAEKHDREVRCARRLHTGPGGGLR